MNDWGLVSIITPTWNCAEYIEETVRSVLAQTYVHWELIIYDDCSTDGTEAVVRPFVEADSKIKYFCNRQNSGAAVTRNHALRVAGGRWVAFLDSDDLWMPQKLERQLRFMVDNQYAFTYHKYVEINESSEETGVLVGGKKVVSKLDMFACCWPGCLSVMYEAEKIGLVQILDVKKNNDTAMWLKIIRKSRCYLLDECLGMYRRRQGSITPPDIRTKIKWHYTLFHEAERQNPVVAVFWMCVNIIGNSYKKLFYVKKYNVKK